MPKTRRRSSTTGGDGLSEAATIGDVKRFLCRLIQRVDRSRVTVKKANCLTQICNVLINAIVDHELEERIDRLEADRDTGWRTPREHTLTIRAGGSHDTEKKPTGTA